MTSDLSTKVPPHMSFRTTALLFGILMGVFWLFGLMLTLQKRKLDPGFLVPTLAQEKGVEIDTVEIHHGGKHYVFLNEKAGWKLRLPGARDEVRADESKVNEIIRQVSKARKTEE